MNAQDIKYATNALKKKVSDRFGSDDELYLFGSAARGDYEPLSDIDVLVLLS
ncbi:MAG: nucleotidyltransferase domain-containing protein [Pseudomonadota bacterium]